jgi:hypothetical protein
MSEIVGKIIVLGETMTVGSAGTFRKRTLVVETDEQYKQTIPIDFVQDKCDVLDSYKAGDSVKISINIRGNEYNGKYYVSLNGWRIEKDVLGSLSPQPGGLPQNNPKQVASVEDEPDSLPF